MRLQSLQSELSKLEKRRAALRAKIQQESKSVFMALPGKVGLKSVDSLVVALAPFASPSMRARLLGSSASAGDGAAGRSVAKSGGAEKAGSRQGAVTAVTPKPASAKAGGSQKFSADVVNLVKREMEAGAGSTALSKKHGIPLSTVKKWKRKWGMTAGTATSTKVAAKKKKE